MGNPLTLALDPGFRRGDEEECMALVRHSAASFLSLIIADSRS
jgi:hypothetical protein